jgi:hypothetical protein
MKAVYKEFICPQCGDLRNINVNDICFDCSNKNILKTLAKQRKLYHKLDVLNQSLSAEI